VGIGLVVVAVRRRDDDGSTPPERDRPMVVDWYRTSMLDCGHDVDVDAAVADGDVVQVQDADTPSSIQEAVLRRPCWGDDDRTPYWGATGETRSSRPHCWGDGVVVVGRRAAAVVVDDDSSYRDGDDIDAAAAVVVVAADRPSSP
jgi:hypothetical protein